MPFARVATTGSGKICASQRRPKLKVKFGSNLPLVLGEEGKVFVLDI